MRKLFVLILGALSLNILKAQDATFWLGADVSGTTQEESRGTKFYNLKGEERDNLTLMKELGMNAVRLRVWVNPRDGFSSKEDVLSLARRAKTLGMEIMVDFHYSDWWADPGKQNIPAAWQHYDYAKMKKAVAGHTRETLSLLKKAGIDVRWVQVGNETTNGFLWPMAQVDRSKPDSSLLQMARYAGLTKAGCKAVKKVYPHATTIIHLDGGCDINRYRYIFDAFRQQQVDYDIIGVSVYPYWDISANLVANEDETLERVIQNIKTLRQDYGRDVMIVETGYEAKRPDEGYAYMRRLIDAARSETNGICKGVFYWAPELEGHYPLGAFDNHRPTKILDAFTEAARSQKEM